MFGSALKQLSSGIVLGVDSELNVIEQSREREQRDLRSRMSVIIDNKTTLCLVAPSSVVAFKGHGTGACEVSGNGVRPSNIADSWALSKVRGS